MANKKLLVLDIDGTLTNSKKEITKKTLDALIACQEAGHKVAIASGRPTPGTLDVARELRLDVYGGYILSFNGAHIVQCKSGEVLYQQTLEQNLISEIYDYCLEHDLGMMTYDESSIITGTRIDEYMELEARINKIPIREVDDFVEYVDFPVKKCLLTKEGDIAKLHEETLKKRYEGRASVYRSEPFFVEIMSLGVDKAASLEQLRQKLDMDRADIIACGDGYNDLSMIQYAGLGVAMANAQPEVKENADYITASNDEDGIAQVVEKFILSQ